MVDKKSDDDTKRVVKGKTLLDMPNPMTTTQSRQATGRPPEPEMAGINPALMLKAWDMHTESNKKLLATIERNEVDNLETRLEGRTTRKIVLGCSATIMVCLFLGFLMVREISEGQKAVLSAALQAGAQLETQNKALRTVSEAMSAFLASEALSDKLEAEEAKWAAPELPVAVAAKRAGLQKLRKLRVVAHAKSLKAQIALAPDAEARVPHEQRLWRVKQEGKKLGILTQDY